MMLIEGTIKTVKLYLKRYLDQSQDRESEQITVDAIRSGIEFKGSTIWILIFAIFIASLGLNTNSTAVIIGAMLISPLMGPIMGIGLGLGINDFELIKKSFRNLAIATIFSVLTSTLYFLISPLNDARSELLARTSPSIYDVLIALFGGLAGIFAMSSKQKGNVLPGVAIATALMPPLCTAGFGLATGNMHYFLGAFYLYCINSVFIAFATTMGVKFMKFSKKQFVDKEREKNVQRIVYSILIFTIIPSVFITYNMVRDNLFQTQAYQYIATQLNFPETQVLNKNAYIKGGEKFVEVSLIGRTVPKDSILWAEAEMKKINGLKNARLIVLQGYQNQEIDMNSLNSMMFQDIYKDSQQKIEHQTYSIDSLRAEVIHYQRYDSLGIEMAPELKVLFPSVTEIGVSNQVFSNLQKMKLDTTTLVVVHFDKNLNNKELTRFKDWLKARLDVKNLRLVME